MNCRMIFLKSGCYCGSIDEAPTVVESDYFFVVARFLSMVLLFLAMSIHHSLIAYPFESCVSPILSGISDYKELGR